MKPRLISFAAFGLANLATAAVAAPDLVANPARLAGGEVVVRNQGDARAKVESVVTINCHQPGMEGGCAEIPAAFEAAYSDPAFPNRLVVRVPRLRPGRSVRHRLPFWAAMVWPSGTYNFDFVVDAGGAVIEGDAGEANNAPPPFVMIVP